MTSWSSRLLRIALLSLCGLLAHDAARAQNLDEYAVKAAFLLNFAAFTEWPESVGKELVLCVVGIDPFGAQLDKLAGRRIGARALLVRRLASLDEGTSCQIVFIARNQAANAPRLIEQSARNATLTVADSEGLGQHGVMINMNLRAERIAFEINASAAKRAGLSISSKLLRLAEAVQ